jgi:capsular exopolysaccharide synthesis family protein
VPLLPMRESVPAAEDFRVLRAQVDGTAGGRSIRSLVVASAVPQEGKTTTAVNLGIALAQAGMRVIVVDANLRKPFIHTVFQRPTSSGLAGALQSNRAGSVVEHLVPTQYEHLYLLPSGQAPANPASLFAPARINALIAELAEHAELIIFDTPALLAVADGALIAGLCDATALVVRSGVTRETTLKSAAERLAQSGAHVIGVILNQAVPTGALATYYGGGGAQSAVGTNEGARMMEQPGTPTESPASKAQTR